MKKEEYQSKLWEMVTIGDYWSKECFDLNNRCILSVGSTKYLKWHNEVMLKYQNALVDFAFKADNRDIVMTKEHFGQFKEF